MRICGSEIEGEKALREALLKHINTVQDLLTPGSQL